MAEPEELTNESPEEDIIDLSDLAEVKPLATFRLSGTEYHVLNPLSLTLHQAAQTELTARVINKHQKSVRSGKATVEQVSEYEQALTNHAALISDVPMDVMVKLLWWQKGYIIGMFQQRSKETQKTAEEAIGDSAPNPRRRKRKSTMAISSPPLPSGTE